MYDPRFVLRSFDTLGSDDKLRILRSLLDSLILVDSLYLMSAPSTPLLYDAGLKYEPEELGRDDWRDVPSVLDHRGGDCFPQGTLLLRDDFALVPVEEVRVGDRIWGRSDWTTVEAVVFKGALSVDTLSTNSGAHVPLTGDHHVFVGRCPEHAPHLDSGYGCSCRLSGRTIEKVRLRELRPKDVLVTPDRIPFGRSEDLDPDRAYVEGLYVSDGWHEHGRFSISGQDGCPKEEQKRRVKAICERLGIGTYWHRKHIRVYDREWSMRVAEMGGHAPEKRILSLDLAELQAAATLRGVMADSRVNPSGGWTFTTTSRELCVQTRVLQKMFGRSSSVMFIQDHGGLGKHPIWRLGVRQPEAKADKLLRVRSVEHDVFEVPCWDIQTSDHYVYLPEHDVTVSNCEDLACWRVAELRLRFGVSADPYVTGKQLNSPKWGPFTLYHIRVLFPDGHIEDPSKNLGMPG